MRQPQGFAPQRLHQAVGYKSVYFLSHNQRAHFAFAVKRVGGGDGFGRGFFAAADFHQRQQINRIERMPDAQALGILHFRLQAGGAQPGSGGCNYGARRQGGVNFLQQRDFNLFALGRAFLREVGGFARFGDGARKAEFAEVFGRFGGQVHSGAAGVFQRGANFFGRFGAGVVDDCVHSGLNESGGPSGADDSAADAGGGFSRGAHDCFSTPIFLRACSGVMMLNPARERMLAAFSVSCALVARTPFFR